MSLEILQAQTIKIFLAGDVMTGRGIDQILAHPSKPILYEGFVKNAKDYVLLAEEKNGKIPPKITNDYIWGDALSEWRKRRPNLKFANLETAITMSDIPSPGKGINYRMNPKNIGVLLPFDALSLSNNHILDWEEAGLLETLKTLEETSIKFSGAGINLENSSKPSIHLLQNKKRVLFFSLSHTSSGVPDSWAAKTKTAGVYLIENLNEPEISKIIENINLYKKAEDLVILSIHWGSNWGYELAPGQQMFAQKLIDNGVDIIFGHSSHHPRPLEIYKGKPIFYGLGDFINDYEGISGYEEFRGDLSLMYFLEFDLKNNLIGLEMVPMQIKKFRLNRPTISDAKWLFKKISEISKHFNTKFKLKDNNIIFEKR